MYGHDSFPVFSDESKVGDGKDMLYYECNNTSSAVMKERLAFYYGVEIVPESEDMPEDTGDGDDNDAANKSTANTPDVSPSKKKKFPFFGNIGKAASNAMNIVKSNLGLSQKTGTGQKLPLDDDEQTTTAGGSAVTGQDWNNNAALPPNYSPNKNAADNNAQSLSPSEKPHTPPGSPVMGPSRGPMSAPLGPTPEPTDVPPVLSMGPSADISFCFVDIDICFEDCEFDFCLKHFFI